MRDSRPYPIDSLFNATAETGGMSITKIQQRAIMLLNLNRAVNALLPLPLRPWYYVANVRQDVMILEAANASWQMRLRYEQHQLLSALRAQILPSLSSIDIRINPSLARKQGLNAKKNDSGRQLYQPLIKKSQQCFSVQSAASILYVTAHSEGKLKDTLERLAKLIRKNAILACREN